MAGTVEDLDRIARADVALAQDPQVRARAAGLGELLDHLRVLEPQRQLTATGRGRPTLTDTTLAMRASCQGAAPAARARARRMAPGAGRTVPWWSPSAPRRTSRYGWRSPRTTLSPETIFTVLANELAGLNALGIGLAEASMPLNFTSAAV